jgi:hypothetical protein
MSTLFLSCIARRTETEYLDGSAAKMMPDWMVVAWRRGCG